MIRYSLSKEISLIIVVKLLVILALWYVCFSNPAQPHIHTQQLQTHLIGTTDFNNNT
jgi:hypothetical protein